MYDTIVNGLVKSSNMKSIEYDILIELKDFKKVDYTKLIKENKKRVCKFGKSLIQEMRGKVGGILDLLVQESIRNEVVYIWQKTKRKN